MAEPEEIKTEKGVYKVRTHYRDVIDAGSFGIVYPGTNADGNPIAAKMIPRSDEKQTMIEKLFRVVAPLLELDHENVVRFYDVVELGKTVWIMMEFCASGNLAKYMKQFRLTLDDKLGIMADATTGIQYLHSQGIIHGDIKPENIVMSGNKAKIADFDQAKVLQPGTLTTTSSSLGTLAFRAPEFFLKDQTSYNQKSDIFSLGLTILGMLQFDGSFMESIIPKIENLTSIVDQTIGQIIAGQITTIIQKNESKNLKVVLVIVGCTLGGVVLGAAAGGYVFLVCSKIAAVAGKDVVATSLFTRLAVQVVGAGAATSKTAGGLTGALAGLILGDVVTDIAVENGYFCEYANEGFNEADREEGDGEKRAALRGLIQSMAAANPEDRPAAGQVQEELKKISQK